MSLRWWVFCPRRGLTSGAARIAGQARNRPWFHASDIPITKPYNSGYKPSRDPEQFVKFSKSDSRRLEEKYREWVSGGSAEGRAERAAKVPVNEDFLFEVDFEKMSLSPTYWEGPTYEVRRGIWFNASNNPLNFSLTKELEDCYAKVDFKAPEGVEGDESLQDVFRLSGNYKKFRFVIFVDEQTAWLLPELNGGDLQLKLLRANVPQLLAREGTKVFRGLSESTLTDAAKKASSAIKTEVATTTKSLGKVSDLISWELPSVFGSASSPEQDRQKDEQDDDEILKREIEADYDNASHQRRDVKHLVLSVHGIGQNLGKKYEYVNFAHTINLLRTNMKKIYSQSKALQKLNKNDGLEDYGTNCSIQVLPITWRHNIGFQTDAKKPNEEYPELPTLGNITVNGVLGLRRLLGDVALDILLYGEPYYRQKILTEVCKQLNQLYRLFKEKNVEFDGEVHLLGHSLGSLILFDILSDQENCRLDFEVNKFFCVGSPVGVFKLIQRTQIGTKNASDKSGIKCQSPQCQDLYNVFHMCDPIAYRLEPLVHNSMGGYEQAYVPHWSEGNSIASKVLELGECFLKDISSPNKKAKTLSGQENRLPVEVSSRLENLNHTGRIDYALLSSFLEVDIISAAKSHVSYFEEMDIAGFLLKQILTKRS